MEKTQKNTVECEERCYLHGNISVRGRHFKGTVIRIVGQRAVVEWQRVIFYPKYERYSKSRSKVHAYIPKCMVKDIKVGDYIEVGECRPISKITHFIVIGKDSAGEKK